MKPLIVALSVVIILGCLQAVLPAAGLAADFPRPAKLTIGYLPVIFHAQIFGAQEQDWLDELGVPKIEFLADKDFLARTVSKALEEHVLPLVVAQQAVRPPAAHMVTNRRALLETLAVYDAFEVKQAVWPQLLKLEEVLDLRFSNAVLQKHPELADAEGR